MRSLLRQWFLVAITGCLWIVQPSLAAGASSVNLVSVEWLETHLGRNDVLVLDASPHPMYAAQHIPGAVHADLFSFGAQELPPADMQRRLQAWGISPGKKVVLYDQDIQRMIGHLGIRPEQQIQTYCGGGVAASVPFFALKFILGYPNVELYRESQVEWMRDDRGLPLWTYSAPFLQRDSSWLHAWGNPMIRSFGIAHLSVVDVRSPSAHQQGHVPFALSLPADVFGSHLAQPRQLAELLGPAGLDPAHEAVIVSEGGLTPASALAFLMLHELGQKKVSILMDSVDEWGLRGFALTKEATVVGAKKTPQDLSVLAMTYPAGPRQGVLITAPGSTQGGYPKVFIAAGRLLPTRPLEGHVIHLPYTELVTPGGTPKAAKDLWNILLKAGLPAYAEIICVSDDPGEAAVIYFVLKLMGRPDVKVWIV